MNSVNLIGNIGGDLELKQTPNGKSVCNFNLAVKGYNKTDWITIVAWNKTAETICSFLHKGSKVGISGRLDTREYTDKNGTKRKAVEVVADSVHFVESKQGGNGKAVQGNAAPSQDDTGEDDFAEIDDDGDLPF